MVFLCPDGLQQDETSCIRRLTFAQWGTRRITDSNWMLSPFRGRRLMESLDFCWGGLTASEWLWFPETWWQGGGGFYAHSFLLSSFLWQAADLLPSHLCIFFPALDSYQVSIRTPKFLLSHLWPPTTQPSCPYSASRPVAVALTFLSSLSRHMSARKAARRVTACCGNALFPCAKLLRGRLAP